MRLVDLCGQEIIIKRSLVDRNVWCQSHPAQPGEEMEVEDTIIICLPTHFARVESSLVSRRASEQSKHPKTQVTFARGPPPPSPIRVLCICKCSGGHRSKILAAHVLLLSRRCRSR